MKERGQPHEECDMIERGQPEETLEREQPRMVLHGWARATAYDKKNEARTTADNRLTMCDDTGASGNDS